MSAIRKGVIPETPIELDLGDMACPIVECSDGVYRRCRDALRFEETRAIVRRLTRGKCP